MLRDAKRADELDPFVQARDQHLRSMRAFAEVMPPHAFFSGRSAALLLGLPLPGPALPVIEVGTERPHSAPKRPGVQGRIFLPGMVAVSTLGGLRVLDRASTWASLGRALSVDDLVCAADALICTPRDRGGFIPIHHDAALATKQELQERLDAARWLGAPKLREALALARDGSESPPETMLRLLLVRGGLPEPELNRGIVHEGSWIADADLLYPEFKVSVEYQGGYHRQAEQYAKDIDRAAKIRAAGWDQVDVAARHLFREPEDVVRRVRQALVGRGWRPQPVKS